MSDIRAKPLFGDDLTDVLRALVRQEGSRRPRSACFERRQLRAQHGARNRLVARVALRVADPEISVVDFIALTIRFRQLVRGSELLTSNQRRRRAKIQFASESARDRLELVLASMGQELGLGRLPDIESVARSVEMQVWEIGRLLEYHLSCNYRECRRALRIRPAMTAVAFSNEQYAQIAYGLRYEHPTQFTHDFSETLGLPPHEFRALIYNRPTN